jgi:hypothetical protein
MGWFLVGMEGKVDENETYAGLSGWERLNGGWYVASLYPNITMGFLSCLDCPRSEVRFICHVMETVT